MSRLKRSKDFAAKPQSVKSERHALGNDNASDWRLSEVATVNHDQFAPLLDLVVNERNEVAVIFALAFSPWNKDAFAGQPASAKTVPLAGVPFEVELYKRIGP